MIYCISDIHGQYNLYMKMLEKIGLEQSDTLFILGDVIDRGEQGIKVLLDIMHRNNVISLLGNHEYMMYNVITKDSEDVKISNSVEYYLWKMNGGEKTYNDYLNLQENDRNSIIKYLENAYIIVPQLKVSEHCFMLVHSTHPAEYIDNPVKMHDIRKEELERVIWKREYIVEQGEEEEIRCYVPDEKYDPDTILVTGHTPTPHIDKDGFMQRGYGIIYYNDAGNLIDIDCGCAIHNRDKRCLGCICLDTMEEFYVREDDKSL